MSISLKQIRPNFSMVEQDGLTLFFSYETLVAVQGIIEGRYVKLRTEEFYSNTTSRHINQACLGKWDMVPQAQLELLVK